MAQAVPARQVDDDDVRERARRQPPHAGCYAAVVLNIFSNDYKCGSGSFQESVRVWSAP